MEQHDDGDFANDEPNARPLMNGSRQTDQERRSIRRSQRLLYKTIEEGGAELELEEIRTKNNDIFRNVLHTREAVLDGENMNAIATRATQQVDRLIQVIQMNLFVMLCGFWFWKFNLHSVAAELLWNGMFVSYRNSPLIRT